MERLWMQKSRKILVSVDSYENGVMRGRFYGESCGEVRFESLSQFLVQMEDMLDQTKLPQAYTAARTFSPLHGTTEELKPVDIKDGSKATFELQILFRQHSSWQGAIAWLDQKAEQSFRSVLELVLLLDSALRG